jgi:hypothetical protein
VGRAVCFFAPSGLACSLPRCAFARFFYLYCLVANMKLASKSSFLAIAFSLEAACSLLAHNDKSPLILHLQKVSGTLAAHKYRRRDGTRPPTSVNLYDNVSHGDSQAM